MDTPIVAKDILTEVIRRGASRLLTAALEAEVETCVERFAVERDEAGLRLVVRNGHARLREIQTGVGSVDTPTAPRAPARAPRRTSSPGSTTGSAPSPRT